ncbi:MAG: sugar ABC transporter permease [Spirochaetaceae bacterium]|nr:MAG: sugar ABC transporter permease [Spirochaetaceae bacterium]
MAANATLRQTRITAYTFLLPNLVGFLVFIALPVLFSFTMSFTNWDGHLRRDFIGFGNYVRMFGNETFRISLANTLVYTFFSVPVSVGIAILLAVILNYGGKMITAYRLFIFLPYVSSTIAIAAVWNLILHPSLGPVNNFLFRLGVDPLPRWFSSSQWALFSVIIVTVWKNVGYYMVIILAALQGIPSSLYECAEIDGAGPLQRFVHVTIPLLTPAIFFAVVIGIIQSFKVFDLIFALTEGGPGRATNVLAYTIYQEAFMRFRMGYASALAVFLFVVIMLFTFIQFRGQKKWVQYM